MYITFASEIYLYPVLVYSQWCVTITSIKFQNVPPPQKEALSYEQSPCPFPSPWTPGVHFLSAASPVLDVSYWWSHAVGPRVSASPTEHCVLNVPPCCGVGQSLLSFCDWFFTYFTLKNTALDTILFITRLPWWWELWLPRKFCTQRNSSLFSPCFWWPQSRTSSGYVQWALVKCPSKSWPNSTHPAGPKGLSGSWPPCAILGCDLQTPGGPCPPLHSPHLPAWASSAGWGLFEPGCHPVKQSWWWWGGEAVSTWQGSGLVDLSPAVSLQVCGPHGAGGRREHPHQPLRRNLPGAAEGEGHSWIRHQH